MQNSFKKLSLVSGVTARDWYGRLPWITLASSLLLTLVGWQIARVDYDKRIANRFDNLATQQATLIQSQLQDYEQALRGGLGLFAASSEVSREAWHEYVESLLMPKYLPGMQGFGYTLMIPKAEKAQHEKKMRAQGFPDYAIYPRGERDPYSSIIYLEPFSGRNLRAFGYDMFSEPVRRKAMERARDTGEAGWSGKITLVQEVDKRRTQAGFLVYLPVYRKDMPHNTIESRRSAIQGFVYAPFRAGDLMESIINDPKRTFEVALYDSVVNPDSLMYESMPGLANPPFVQDRVIELGGNSWILRIFSNNEFSVVASDHVPQMILWVGILASLAAFSFLIFDAAQKRRVSQANRATEARAQESELIARMTELLLCCESTDEAVPIITSSMRQLFPEESGACYLMDDASETAFKIAEWGKTAPFANSFQQGDCWALKRSNYHAANFGGFDNIRCKHVAQNETAYICVPMITQSHALGSLYMEDHFKLRTDEQNEHLIALAKAVADSISLSLSNLRLRESLRESAIRDVLTGLYNRRFMQESLTRELTRIRRVGSVVALALIDVDHFKNFNDTFGHDAGDEVLRSIGQLLTNFRKGEDLACRYGGEEFLLVLPEIGFEKTVEKLEGLRKLVTNLSLFHEGKPLPKITISIGVAFFPEEANSIESLIKLADTALYSAKQAGRDRIVYAKNINQTNQAFSA